MAQYPIEDGSTRKAAATFVSAAAIGAVPPVAPPFREGIRAMTPNQFEPGKFCASCGKCCKSLPGGVLPTDFGLDMIEGIRSALASGRYAIDWWEGDIDGQDDLPQVMFIRPATKGLEGKVFDASWGGECTFLTSAGCGLPRDQMPSECKALRPRTTAEGDCPSTFTKEDVCREWRPYQSLLGMIGGELQKAEAA